MSGQKTVHVVFNLEDHQLLKKAATDYGMPMATWCKAMILAKLKGDTDTEVSTPPVPEMETYTRKPRTIGGRYS